MRNEIVVASIPPPELILASSSRYRAELLARLGLPFSQQSPDIDETPGRDESAVPLAQRLALAKAQAIAQRAPGAWVIGSDQVAACEGSLLGKPGNRERAVEQLRFLSGKHAAFVTALALVRVGGETHRDFDTTVVRFRKLAESEIERYVDAEPAYDCAGSAKIEGLGIALTAEVQSRDPTALIGLPLIATARLLRKAGYLLP
jgi:septum formation protein